MAVFLLPGDKWEILKKSCLNYPKGGTENSHLKVGPTVPVSRFCSAIFHLTGTVSPTILTYNSSASSTTSAVNQTFLKSFPEEN